MSPIKQLEGCIEVIETIDHNDEMHTFDNVVIQWAIDNAADLTNKQMKLLKKKCRKLTRSVKAYNCQW